MLEILKLKMSREELINSWNKLVKRMLNSVSLDGFSSRHLIFAEDRC